MPSLAARTVPETSTHCPASGAACPEAIGTLAGCASMTQWVMTRRVRPKPSSVGATNPVRVTSWPSKVSGEVEVANTVAHSPMPKVEVSPDAARVTAS